jgi:hypothetical protein
MWFFQGFRKIIVLDALSENGDALALAVKRLNISHPDRSIDLFSIQRDSRVRAFIAENIPGRELGRTEYGMLSMAAWIDRGLVRDIDRGPEDDLPPAIKPDADRFRKWHKRGADPEQFRKLFPQGSSSTIATRFDADFGKRLFEYILPLLEEAVASPLPSTTTNRKTHAPSNNC